MKRNIGISVLLVSTVCYCVPSLRAQSVPLDLTEMIGSSGMIFAGTVMEVRSEPDERNDIATYTTFRVETPIRGVEPGTLTIKQFGGSSPNGSMVVPHMRYFTQGERVLLMLYPPSELGFTSPIGMGSGVWKVDDEGMVHGITGNLLGDLSVAAARYGVKPGWSGTARLTDMISLIRAVTNGGN